MIFVTCLACINLLPRVYFILILDGNAVIKGVCLGMSGVDREEDELLVRCWVNEVLPGVPCFVCSDAGKPTCQFLLYCFQIRGNYSTVIALAAGAEGDLDGVVVISGTGMTTDKRHKPIPNASVRLLLLNVPFHRQEPLPWQ